MTTAILVDDEAILLHHLKKILLNLWEDLTVLASFQDGKSALDFCKHQPVDIIFTDIKMPEMDGLEFVSQLQNHLSEQHKGTLANQKPSHFPKIVFITAYSEHAVKAFEKAAVDYIVKPISEERLLNTVNRLQEHVSSYNQSHIDINALLSQLNHNQQQTKYLKWLKVSHHDGVEIVGIDEVLYFEAADKYTTVKTQHHEYIIRTSLKSLSLELDPDQFWRVHRNCIVKVAAIESVKSDITGGMNLTLKRMKKKIKVSRRFAQQFRQQ